MDAPAGVTHDFVLFIPPSFCGACLHFSSREKFSRSFPSSTVKSNFVYPRHNRSPLVGHDYVRQKNPTSCDCAEIRTHVPTSEKVSRSPTEPPGRPVKVKSHNYGFEITKSTTGATGKFSIIPILYNNQIQTRQQKMMSGANGARTTRARSTK